MSLTQPFVGIPASMYRTKPQRERSGLASVERAALPTPSPQPSPHPTPSLVLRRHRGGKFCPLLASFPFSRGCALCAQLCHEECRSLYPLLSLNMVRHAPEVVGLSQENLSYWIWKLFKQSGRPGCLIFMRTLGLLSWWRADHKETICMYLSPGSPGDLSQEHCLYRPRALIKKVCLCPKNPLRGEGSMVFQHCLVITHSIAPI